MIALQLARIVMCITHFIKFADEDLLHPEAAAQMRSILAHNLRSFDKAFLRELVDALATIAGEYSGEKAKLARDIPSYFDLEQALVAQTEAGAASTVAVQVARLIADFVIFMDHVDEDLMDLDANVTLTEYVGAEIDALDKDFLRQVVDAFPIIANDYEGEERETVLTVVDNFYLEETLAEGDPVRLAELEALRDARG